MVDPQQAPEQIPEDATATTEPAIQDINTDKTQHPEDLNRQLEDAHAKANQHWNQLLRVRAEMENLQKRQARELENAHKFALDNFVRELLQIWDSLELGHAAAQIPDTDIAKINEGMELTLKLFSDVMNKFGVKQIDPKEEAFNPEYHQAMTVQPSADLAPNSVISVLQKGYTLNGRLVRPALVVVSKAQEQEQAQTQLQEQPTDIITDTTVTEDV